jgi:hypothetical protein
MIVCDLDVDRLDQPRIIIFRTVAGVLTWQATCTPVGAASARLSPRPVKPLRLRGG